jgi:tRNA-specific 2-thiouridylase
MKGNKAFSLLSGGLDSLLATRLVMSQGIEVTGLHFITPFFGYDKKGREREIEEKWRSLYGIQARIIDVGEEYLEIVRHPRYGYGRNFNPCIDCKIFMFSKAKALMEDEGGDFLVTGEVLGQRPMSQRRDALRVVERDSGTDGILLRPLCARNLKPTRPELEGLVDREKLLNLSGRSRKPQMKLAEEMGLRHYPAPAGGCLLTDPVLAERTKKFFSQFQRFAVNDVLLLQVGRHFQLAGGARLVVGRRDAENQRLMALRNTDDVLLKLQGIPGPVGLVRGEAAEGDLRLGASIVARYSKAKEREVVEVQAIRDTASISQFLSTVPAKDEEIAPWKF